MPLANKNTRRTSDFQGVQRAQGRPADVKIGKVRPGKDKRMSVKAPTNAKDISAILRALRQRRP